MFKKSAEKIQVALKSAKNNGYFTRRPIYIYDISLHSSCNEKCFPDTSSKENQNTLFVFSKLFFGNLAIYEITWKHVALGRPQYNSTSGPRRDDESGVKGVRGLAMVGTTMSKRFWDTGVL